MTPMYLAYTASEFKAKQNALFDDLHNARRYAGNIGGDVLPLPVNPYVELLSSGKRHYYIELDLSDLKKQFMELSPRFDSTNNFGFIKEVMRGPLLDSDRFNFFYFYCWADDDKDALKQAQEKYRQLESAGVVPERTAEVQDKVVG